MTPESQELIFSIFTATLSEKLVSIGMKTKVVNKVRKVIEDEDLLIMVPEIVNSLNKKKKLLSNKAKRQKMYVYMGTGDWGFLDYIIKLTMERYASHYNHSVSTVDLNGGN